MREQITKLILTRYNMTVSFDSKAAWYEGRPVNLDADWLAERKRLFLTYCWPSLARQTYPDFQLLLFVDKRTDPQYLRDLMVDDRIVPVSMAAEQRGSIGRIMDGAINRYIENRWGRAKRVYQTSRLDSDDALAPSYLEEVEKAAAAIAHGGVGNYFHFPLGEQFVEETESYREYVYPGNAFGTRIALHDGARVQTCYSLQHKEFLKETYSQAVSTKTAQWCMVIHGQNVLNTARGTEIAVPDFRVGRNAEL